MNKSEKISITTWLVVLSFLAKCNSTIAETLKINDKEISKSEQIINVGENTNNNLKSTLNLVWWTPPDTTTIKNFFIKGNFFNPQEMKDFKCMRAESIRSSSRPAVELTMFDIRKLASDDYEKSVFITAFLDPLQKTTLGKAAFQEINKDQSIKWLFGVCCKIHIQNIETIKINKSLEQSKKSLEQSKKSLEQSKKELEQSKKELQEATEVLQLLQQIEEVYKKYLNK